MKDFGSNNEHLRSDLSNKIQDIKMKNSLEEQYYILVGTLKSIFKQMEKDIVSVPRLLSKAFNKNLKIYIKENVNSQISNFIFDSKINRMLQFLSEDNMLQIPEMVELGLVHGLMENPKKYEVNVKYDILDMTNYPNINTKLII